MLYLDLKEKSIVFAKAQSHKIGDISSVIHPYPTHGAILQQSADLYWKEKLFDGMLPKVAEKYIQWFRWSIESLNTKENDIGMDIV